LALAAIVRLTRARLFFHRTCKAERVRSELANDLPRSCTAQTLHEARNEPMAGILIVEDDADLVVMLSEQLALEGHTARVRLRRRGTMARNG
jgi:hypothetical protein